jgi:hypothetical protein
MQSLDSENLDALVDPLLVDVAPGSSSEHSDVSINKTDGLSLSLMEIINHHIKIITPEAVSMWQRTADDFDGHLNICMSNPFLDLCITDNNIGGHAVKMYSDSFNFPSTGARIGGCRFFNLPGSDSSNPINQVLRVYPDANKRPEFVLTFWGKLFTGRSGETNLGWASSINLTDAVVQVALRCEETETKVGSCDSQSSDDEFGDDHWDPYLAKLLVFIYTLQTYHSSVLVLGPSTVHQPQSSELLPDFGDPTAKMPMHYQLKYMSAAVYNSGQDTATNIAKMTQNGRTRMGAWLCHRGNHRIHIVWGEEAEKKTLYCVPITDGRYDRVPQDIWWMCFMVSDKATNVW